MTAGAAAVVEATDWGGRVTPAAAPLTFNEIYRLVQVTDYNNVIACLNVFYFGTESVGNSPNSLVTDWATAIVPTWKQNVTNAITFKEVYAEQTVPEQSAIASVALSGTGGVIALPAPCVCAGVITWRTQLIGRRYRGRTYIAGLEYSAPQTSNGEQWQGTGVTRLTNLGTAILNRYTLGGNPYGFQLIVWSRANYTEAPDLWGAAATMVTRFSAQPYIATMGTRRSGRGM